MAMFGYPPSLGDDGWIHAQCEFGCHASFLLYVWISIIKYVKIKEKQIKSEKYVLKIGIMTISIGCIPFLLCTKTAWTKKMVFVEIIAICNML